MERTRHEVPSRKGSEVQLEVDRVPVFHAEGAADAGDYTCSECGYGVSVKGRLPVCPMCRGRRWEDARTAGAARWVPSPTA